jgi:phosphomevalonate kinase
VRLLSSSGVVSKIARLLGLGSSAALVTSIVGTLLAYTTRHITVDGRRQLDCARDDDLMRVHNCAQLAHCVAQGKIGSGYASVRLCYIA